MLIEPAGLFFETEANMKIKVVVHEAEEGGFWAEVPANSGMRDAGREHGRAVAQSSRSDRRLPFG